MYNRIVINHKTFMAGDMLVFSFGVIWIITRSALSYNDLYVQINFIRFEKFGSEIHSELFQVGSALYDIMLIRNNDL